MILGVRRCESSWTLLQSETSELGASKEPIYPAKRDSGMDETEVGPLADRRRVMWRPCSPSVMAIPGKSPSSRPPILKQESRLAKSGGKLPQHVLVASTELI